VAYTPVTVDDFTARFPNLADTDEVVIQACLDEAARSVDDSWLSQTDYTGGLLYLAAHLVATDNSTEGTSVTIGAGGGGVASESFGGMSISYDKSAGVNDAASKSQWGSTEYGRRFYRLLKLNKPAIVSI
jgi:hypothetical protein